MSQIVLVDTPPIRASWITVTSVLSAVLWAPGRVEGHRVMRISPLPVRGDAGKLPPQGREDAVGRGVRAEGPHSTLVARSGLCIRSEESAFGSCSSSVQDPVALIREPPNNELLVRHY
jgi:hypothetical protein